jgi:hypothetical protein
MSSNDVVWSQPDDPDFPLPIDRPTGECETSDSSIDPRFDPAFQRGYRPEPDIVTTAQQPPVRMPAVLRPASGIRENAPAERASEDASVEPPGGAEPTADGEPQGTEPSPDDETPNVQLRPPRANPYLTALWIIGIGFVVVGIATQFWARTTIMSFSYQPGGGTSVDAVLLNLTYSVGVPMITMGLATIVGLLFLLAVRHGGRPRRP